MNENIENKLKEAYPQILGKITFETDDGWASLIKDLCAKLHLMYRLTGISTTAAQVKEKFGGIRFYTTTTTPLESRLAGEDQHLIHELLYDLRAQAEHRSYNVCEICGDDGTTKSISGYSQTLCDDHRAIRAICLRLADRPDITSIHDMAAVTKGVQWDGDISVHSAANWLKRLLPEDDLYTTRAKIEQNIADCLLYVPVHGQNKDVTTALAVSCIAQALSFNSKALELLGVPSVVIELLDCIHDNGTPLCHDMNVVYVARAIAMVDADGWLEQAEKRAALKQELADA